jgi:hypothetical protein
MPGNGALKVLSEHAVRKVSLTMPDRTDLKKGEMAT